MSKKKQPGGSRKSVGRPRKYDESMVSILLHLPGDLAVRLAKATAKLGISRTEAIHEAIRHWLSRK